MSEYSRAELLICILARMLEGCRSAVLPAINPDVALFHAPLGDRLGNVWVGNRRDCVIMAHASRSTLVTVEEIHDGNPRRSAGQPAGR